ncbi:hypothetical protein UCD39_16270 [Nitrospirillum sp. BR 11752]|uniref:hypothetical protein n=1 Tax=Nitrospirillum sp. BR 11752 TaxID=3104293 RepID=UPI002EB490F4|nr:hypothetical protein [Nitrospirillum sp. BR 11752]
MSESAKTLSEFRKHLKDLARRPPPPPSPNIVIDSSYLGVGYTILELTVVARSDNPNVGFIWIGAVISKDGNPILSGLGGTLALSPGADCIVDVVLDGSNAGIKPGDEFDLRVVAFLGGENVIETSTKITAGLITQL